MECSLAIDVLDWFLCLRKWFLPLKWFLPQCKYPTDTEILFGFDPARRIPLVYSALLGIVRHLRFDRTDPDLDIVIGKYRPFMAVFWHGGEDRTLCWSAFWVATPWVAGSQGLGSIAPSESFSPLSFNSK
ncbi:Hypothetical predicted protein [Paramuricea clavata]|uniref:Uncharacterized protein n=1 Tax=Paramuricea clavata TaxID=317549 RepID=A0A7D9IQG9_PARCT|nr:Hypothetical predicted protein [Paramuricea clavata]